MMVPLTKEQKESILKRIAFIEIELSDLKEYQDLDFKSYSSDRTIRRNVERLLENVANATTDIAKIFLSGEEIELPPTYREVILKLGELNIADEKVVREVAELARARNILAHQYLDIRWALVKDFLKKGSKKVKKFLKRIKTNF